MNEKKFEILYDYKKTLTCIINDVVTQVDVYQIRALKDFNGIRQGELGGYIESEYNLSHEGNCWIYDEGKVFGQAKICDNVSVKGYAQVYGDGEIHGNICIKSFAKLYMNNSTLNGDGEIK